MIRSRCGQLSHSAVNGPARPALLLRVQIVAEYARVVTASSVAFRPTASPHFLLNQPAHFAVHQISNSYLRRRRRTADFSGFASAQERR
ncbi:hypothetical protein EVAR_31379_1 [Eumeta japonica]|uniref:Uncharacterized protein n=1 Tax=Eumeta variegata TaxID=151549 RepID=A0A4C1X8I5_EUMVA|nr:hypothetical protein EVAR_31379_1 [Eumeta japonica]